MPTSATGTSTTSFNGVPPMCRLMPQQASGVQTRRAQTGFTLLELMVVVFIIALVAAGAIISLGATGKDSQLERERDRLTALMSYIRERGAMLTLEYGIVCGQHGYRFVYFDNRSNQWQPESADDTLRARKLPAGLQFALTIEGHPIVLDDKNLTVSKSATTASGGLVSQLGTDMPNSFSAQRANNAPQILLLSNGDVNSFVLTLSRPTAERSTTLKSTVDNDIQAGDIVEPK
jgi:general secretion pathway protein H